MLLERGVSSSVGSTLFSSAFVFASTCWLHAKSRVAQTDSAKTLTMLYGIPILGTGDIEWGFAP